MHAGDIISRDGRTIIIIIIIIIYNIKFAHSCTVHVGLAQARPNNCIEGKEYWRARTKLAKIANSVIIDSDDLARQ